MAQGFWIIALQQGAAAAAGIRVMIHYLVTALNWQQLRPGTRVALLAAALTASALAACRRFKTLAITGGWL